MESVIRVSARSLADNLRPPFSAVPVMSLDVKPFPLGVSFGEFGTSKERTEPVRDLNIIVVAVVMRRINPPRSMGIHPGSATRRWEGGTGQLVPAWSVTCAA